MFSRRKRKPSNQPRFLQYQFKCFIFFSMICIIEYLICVMCDCPLPMEMWCLRCIKFGVYLYSMRDSHAMYASHAVAKPTHQVWKPTDCVRAKYLLCIFTYFFTFHRALQSPVSFTQFSIIIVETPGFFGSFLLFYGVHEDEKSHNENYGTYRSFQG